MRSPRGTSSTVSVALATSAMVPAFMPPPVLALPTTMKKLDNEIGALESKLADAALFARDPKAFDQAVSRLSAAREELAKAEEQWLELEMKREMLEG